MGVSKNRAGPPKSSILIGFSIIFTIHFGVPPFVVNTHIPKKQSSSLQISLSSSRRAAWCLTGHLRSATLDPNGLFIEPLQEFVLSTFGLKCFCLISPHHRGWHWCIWFIWFIYPFLWDNDWDLRFIGVFVWGLSHWIGISYCAKYL